MTSTIVPAAVVITRVKIEKQAKLGMYVLRSEALGSMAVAATREVLRKIASRQGWAIVKNWASAPAWTVAPDTAMSAARAVA
jgi:hypothetical protein